MDYNLRLGRLSWRPTMLGVAKCRCRGEENYSLAGKPARPPLVRLSFVVDVVGVFVVG